MASNCDAWCGVSRERVKKGIIRQATRIGNSRQPPVTPEVVIEEWLAALWDKSMQASMTNGRFIISTSEASGSVTFASPDTGGGSKAIMDLLEEILADLTGTGGRVIKRLRICFNIQAV